MSELDFEVEKTSFILSVIDIIEEYIKAEFYLIMKSKKKIFSIFIII